MYTNQATYRDVSLTHANHISNDHIPNEHVQRYALIPTCLTESYPNPLDAQCHGAPQLVLASVQNGILVRLGYSDYFHLSIYEYFDILCALSFFALSLLG